MLRVVSRRVFRVQLSRSSALRTTAIRSFSEVVPVVGAAAPVNLRTIRHELSRVLDEDASHLGGAPDQGLIEYIKAQGMKIVADRDGEIKAVRLVGDYEITVAFQAETDDMMDEEQENPHNQEEDGPKDLTEEEEENIDLPSHGFLIDIKHVNASKAATIRFGAHASKKGELVVDSLFFDPKPLTAESHEYGLEGDRLDVGDLSESGQEKVLEMMETLNLDDKLAQFVQHYAQVVRTQQYLDKLRKFKAFLQN